MIIESPAFKNEERLPVVYTCEGENLSPPLSWSGVPENTEALVLIVDDPDAPSGNFTHWAVYNLPPTPSRLDEGVSLSNRFSEGLREGVNSMGKQGYSAPCPPRGASEHRYFFRLYALSQKLNLKGRVTRSAHGCNGRKDLG